MLEGRSFADLVQDGLDRATAPLWARLDEYGRAIVAAFFVAIVAVGSVYLTHGPQAGEGPGAPPTKRP